MRLVWGTLVLVSALAINWSAGNVNAAGDLANAPITGFREPAKQREIEARFLAAPDPKLAEEHLRILTQAPHIAGSPEDKATAEYVAQKFRDAGLKTEIVEYRVWLNYPEEISVDLTGPAGVKMHGPTREHVEGDPFQDVPRVVMAYNGMSPSGDAEAEVVYANYGSPDDFDRLKQLGVDVRGKIALVRYGQNFRGVKAFVAQERGAAGVLIYSDPADDGWRRGDKYPAGPWIRECSADRSDSCSSIREIPRRRALRPCLRWLSPNAQRPSKQRNLRRFRRHRFHMQTRGRSSSIWAGPSLHENGRDRCHSPITWVRGRRR